MGNLAETSVILGYSVTVFAIVVVGSLTLFCCIPCVACGIMCCLARRRKHKKCDSHECKKCKHPKDTKTEPGNVVKNHPSPVIVYAVSLFFLLC